MELDLSFLTLEEYDIILNVLKRDEKVRTVDEKRVKTLRRKSVNYDERKKNTMKIFTGEWIGHFTRPGRNLIRSASSMVTDIFSSTRIVNLSITPREENTRSEVGARESGGLVRGKPVKDESQVIQPKVVAQDIATTSQRGTQSVNAEIVAVSTAQGDYKTTQVEEQTDDKTTTCLTSEQTNKCRDNSEVDASVLLNIRVKGKDVKITSKVDTAGSSSVEGDNITGTEIGDQVDCIPSIKDDICGAEEGNEANIDSPRFRTLFDDAFTSWQEVRGASQGEILAESTVFEEEVVPKICQNQITLTPKIQRDQTQFKKELSEIAEDDFTPVPSSRNDVASNKDSSVNQELIAHIKVDHKDFKSGSSEEFLPDKSHVTITENNETSTQTTLLGSEFNVETPVDICRSLESIDFEHTRQRESLEEITHISDDLKDSSQLSTQWRGSSELCKPGTAIETSDQNFLPLPGKEERNSSVSDEGSISSIGGDNLYLVEFLESLPTIEQEEKAESKFALSLVGRQFSIDSITSADAVLTLVEDLVQNVERMTGHPEEETSNSFDFDKVEAFDVNSPKIESKTSTAVSDWQTGSSVEYLETFEVESILRSEADAGVGVQTETAEQQLDNVKVVRDEISVVIYEEGISSVDKRDATKIPEVVTVDLTSMGTDSMVQSNSTEFKSHQDTAIDSTSVTSIDNAPEETTTESHFITDTSSVDKQKEVLQKKEPEDQLADDSEDKSTQEQEVDRSGEVSRDLGVHESQQFLNQTDDSGYDVSHAVPEKIQAVEADHVVGEQRDTADLPISAVKEHKPVDRGDNSEAYAADSIQSLTENQSTEPHELKSSVPSTSHLLTEIETTTATHEFDDNIDKNQEKYEQEFSSGKDGVDVMSSQLREIIDVSTPVTHTEDETSTAEAFRAPIVLSQHEQHESTENTSDHSKAYSDTYSSSTDISVTPNQAAVIDDIKAFDVVLQSSGETEIAVISSAQEVRISDDIQYTEQESSPVLVNERESDSSNVSAIIVITESQPDAVQNSESPPEDVNSQTMMTESLVLEDKVVAMTAVKNEIQTEEEEPFVSHSDDVTLISSDAEIAEKEPDLSSENDSAVHARVIESVDENIVSGIEEELFPKSPEHEAPEKVSDDLTTKDVPLYESQEDLGDAGNGNDELSSKGSSSADAEDFPSSKVSEYVTIGSQDYFKYEGISDDEVEFSDVKPVSESSVTIKKIPKISITDYDEDIAELRLSDYVLRQDQSDESDCYISDADDVEFVIDTPYTSGTFSAQKTEENDEITSEGSEEICGSEFRSIPHSDNDDNYFTPSEFHDEEIQGSSTKTKSIPTIRITEPDEPEIEESDEGDDFSDDSNREDDNRAEDVEDKYGETHYRTSVLNEEELSGHTSEDVNSRANTPLTTSDSSFQQKTDELSANDQTDAVANQFMMDAEMAEETDESKDLESSEVGPHTLVDAVDVSSMETRGRSDPLAERVMAETTEAEVEIDTGTSKSFKEKSDDTKVVDGEDESNDFMSLKEILSELKQADMATITEERIPSGKESKQQTAPEDVNLEMTKSDALDLEGLTEAQQTDSSRDDAADLVSVTETNVPNVSSADITAKYDQSETESILMPGTDEQGAETEEQSETSPSTSDESDADTVIEGNLDATDECRIESLRNDDLNERCTTDDTGVCQKVLVPTDGNAGDGENVESMSRDQEEKVGENIAESNQTITDSYCGLESGETREYSEADIEVVSLKEILSEFYLGKATASTADPSEMEQPVQLPSIPFVEKSEDMQSEVDTRAQIPSEDSVITVDLRCEQQALESEGSTEAKGATIEFSSLSKLNTFNPLLSNEQETLLEQAKTLLPVSADDEHDVLPSQPSVSSESVYEFTQEVSASTTFKQGDTPPTVLSETASSAASMTVLVGQYQESSSEESVQSAIFVPQANGGDEKSDVDNIPGLSVIVDVDDLRTSEVQSVVVVDSVSEDQIVIQEALNDMLYKVDAKFETVVTVNELEISRENSSMVIPGAEPQFSGLPEFAETREITPEETELFSLKEILRESVTEMQPMDETNTDSSFAVFAPQKVMQPESRIEKHDDVEMYQEPPSQVEVVQTDLPAIDEEPADESQRDAQAVIADDIAEIFAGKLTSNVEITDLADVIQEAPHHLETVIEEDETEAETLSTEVKYTSKNLAEDASEAELTKSGDKEIVVSAVVEVGKEMIQGALGEEAVKEKGLKVVKKGKKISSSPVKKKSIKRKVTKKRKDTGPIGFTREDSETAKTDSTLDSTDTPTTVNEDQSRVLDEVACDGKMPEQKEAAFVGYQSQIQDSDALSQQAAEVPEKEREQDVDMNKSEDNSSFRRMEDLDIGGNDTTGMKENIDDSDHSIVFDSLPQSDSLDNEARRNHPCVSDEPIPISNLESVTADSGLDSPVVANDFSLPTTEGTVAQPVESEQVPSVIPHDKEGGFENPGLEASKEEIFVVASAIELPSDGATKLTSLPGTSEYLPQTRTIHYEGIVSHEVHKDNSEDLSENKVSGIIPLDIMQRDNQHTINDESPPAAFDTDLHTEVDKNTSKEETPMTGSEIPSNDEKELSIEIANADVTNYATEASILPCQVKHDDVTPGDIPPELQFEVGIGFTNAEARETSPGEILASENSGEYPVYAISNVTDAEVTENIDRDAIQNVTENKVAATNDEQESREDLNLSVSEEKTDKKRKGSKKVIKKAKKPSEMGDDEKPKKATIKKKSVKRKVVKKPTGDPTKDISDEDQPAWNKTEENVLLDSTYTVTENEPTLISTKTQLSDLAETTAEADKYDETYERKEEAESVSTNNATLSDQMPKLEAVEELHRTETEELRCMEGDADNNLIISEESVLTCFRSEPTAAADEEKEILDTSGIQHNKALAPEKDMLSSAKSETAEAAADEIDNLNASDIQQNNDLVSEPEKPTELTKEEVRDSTSTDNIVPNFEEVKQVSADVIILAEIDESHADSKNEFDEENYFMKPSAALEELRIETPSAIEFHPGEVDTVSSHGDGNQLNDASEGIVENKHAEGDQVLGKVRELVVEVGASEISSSRSNSELPEVDYATVILKDESEQEKREAEDVNQTEVTLQHNLRSELESTEYELGASSNEDGKSEANVDLESPIETVQKSKDYDICTSMSVESEVQSTVLELVVRTADTNVDEVDKIAADDETILAQKMAEGELSVGNELMQEVQAYLKCDAVVEDSKLTTAETPENNDVEILGDGAPSLSTGISGKESDENFLSGEKKSQKKRKISKKVKKPERSTEGAQGTDTSRNPAMKKKSVKRKVIKKTGEKTNVDADNLPTAKGPDDHATAESDIHTTTEFASQSIDETIDAHLTELAKSEETQDEDIHPTDEAVPDEPVPQTDAFIEQHDELKSSNIGGNEEAEPKDSSDKGILDLLQHDNKQTRENFERFESEEIANIAQDVAVVLQGDQKTSSNMSLTGDEPIVDIQHSIAQETGGSFAEFSDSFHVSVKEVEDAEKEGDDESKFVQKLEESDDVVTTEVADKTEENLNMPSLAIDHVNKAVETAILNQESDETTTVAHANLEGVLVLGDSENRDEISTDAKIKMVGKVSKKSKKLKSEKEEPTDGKTSVKKKSVKRKVIKKTDHPPSKGEQEISHFEEGESIEVSQLELAALASTESSDIVQEDEKNVQVKIDKHVTESNIVFADAKQSDILLEKYQEEDVIPTETAENQGERILQVEMQEVPRGVEVAELDAPITDTLAGSVVEDERTIEVQPSVGEQFVTPILQELAIEDSETNISVETEGEGLTKKMEETSLKNTETEGTQADQDTVGEESIQDDPAASIIEMEGDLKIKKEADDSTVIEVTSIQSDVVSDDKVRIVTDESLENVKDATEVQESIAAIHDLNTSHVNREAGGYSAATSVEVFDILASAGVSPRSLPSDQALDAASSKMDDEQIDTAIGEQEDISFELSHEIAEKDTSVKKKVTRKSLKKTIKKTKPSLEEEKSDTSETNTPARKKTIKRRVVKKTNKDENDADDKGTGEGISQEDSTIDEASKADALTEKNIDETESLPRDIGSEKLSDVGQVIGLEATDDERQTENVTISIEESNRPEDAVAVAQAMSEEHLSFDETTGQSLTADFEGQAFPEAPRVEHATDGEAPEILPDAQVLDVTSPERDDGQLKSAVGEQADTTLDDTGLEFPQKTSEEDTSVKKKVTRKSTKRVVKKAKPPLETKYDTSDATLPQRKKTIKRKVVKKTKEHEEPADGKEAGEEMSTNDQMEEVNAIDEVGKVTTVTKEMVVESESLSGDVGKVESEMQFPEVNQAMEVEAPENKQQTNNVTASVEENKWREDATSQAISEEHLSFGETTGQFVSTDAEMYTEQQSKEKSEVENIDTMTQDSKSYDDTTLQFVMEQHHSLNEESIYSSVVDSVAIVEPARDASEQSEVSAPESTSADANMHDFAALKFEEAEDVKRDETAVTVMKNTVATLASSGGFEADGDSSDNTKGSTLSEGSTLSYGGDNPAMTVKEGDATTFEGRSPQDEQSPVVDNADVLNKVEENTETKARKMKKSIKKVVKKSKPLPEASGTAEADSSGKKKSTKRKIVKKTKGSENIPESDDPVDSKMEFAKAENIFDEQDVVDSESLEKERTGAGDRHVNEGDQDTSLDHDSPAIAIGDAMDTQNIDYDSRNVLTLKQLASSSDDQISNLVTNEAVTCEGTSSVDESVIPRVIDGNDVTLQSLNDGESDAVVVASVEPASPVMKDNSASQLQGDQKVEDGTEPVENTIETKVVDSTKKVRKPSKKIVKKTKPTTNKNADASLDTSSPAKKKSIKKKVVKKTQDNQDESKTVGEVTAEFSETDRQDAEGQEATDKLATELSIAMEASDILPSDHKEKVLSDTSSSDHGNFAAVRDNVQLEVDKGVSDTDTKQDQNEVEFGVLPIFEAVGSKDDVANQDGFESRSAAGHDDKSVAAKIGDDVTEYNSALTSADNQTATFGDIIDADGSKDDDHSSKAPTEQTEQITVQEGKDAKKSKKKIVKQSKDLLASSSPSRKKSIKRKVVKKSKDHSPESTDLNAASQEETSVQELDCKLVAEPETVAEVGNVDSLNENAFGTGPGPSEDRPRNATEDDQPSTITAEVGSTEQSPSTVKQTQVERPDDNAEILEVPTHEPASRVEASDVMETVGDETMDVPDETAMITSPDHEKNPIAIAQRETDINITENNAENFGSPIVDHSAGYTETAAVVDDVASTPGDEDIDNKLEESKDVVETGVLHEVKKVKKSSKRIVKKSKPALETMTDSSEKVSPSRKKSVKRKVLKKVIDAAQDSDVLEEDKSKHDEVEAVAEKEEERKDILGRLTQSEQLDSVVVLPQSEDSSFLSATEQVAETPDIHVKISEKDPLFDEVENKDRDGSDGVLFKSEELSDKTQSLEDAGVTEMTAGESKVDTAESEKDPDARSVEETTLDQDLSSEVDPVLAPKAVKKVVKKTKSELGVESTRKKKSMKKKIVKKREVPQEESVESTETSIATEETQIFETSDTNAGTFDDNQITDIALAPDPINVMPAETEPRTELRGDDDVINNDTVVVDTIGDGSVNISSNQPDKVQPHDDDPSLLTEGIDAATASEISGIQGNESREAVPKFRKGTKKVAKKSKGELTEKDDQGESSSKKKSVRKKVVKKVKAPVDGIDASTTLPAQNDQPSEDQMDASDKIIADDQVMSKDETVDQSDSAVPVTEKEELEVSESPLSQGAADDSESISTSYANNGDEKSEVEAQNPNSTSKSRKALRRHVSNASIELGLKKDDSTSEATKSPVRVIKMVSNAKKTSEEIEDTESVQVDKTSETDPANDDSQSIEVSDATEKSVNPSADEEDTISNQTVSSLVEETDSVAHAGEVSIDPSDGKETAMLGLAESVEEISGANEDAPPIDEGEKAKGPAPKTKIIRKSKKLIKKPKEASDVEQTSPATSASKPSPRKATVKKKVVKKTPKLKPKEDE